MTDNLPTTELIGNVAARFLRSTPRPWHGGKITEPGIYRDVPMEFYHSDCCDGPSISSSGLRKITSESPLHYWFDSPYNPNRPAQEQKQHFNLGSAVHTLLLGETGFRDKFVVRPTFWSDWRTKEARAWRDEMVSAGKTVITDSDVDAIRHMAVSMQREPLVHRDGLFSGAPELSLFWKDAETGIWLKSRPDNLHLPADAVADLKTTTNASAESCARSIADFGYHQQLALAAEGIHALTGHVVPNDGFILVFIETKAPYAVNLKPIDANAIYIGMAQNRHAIRVAAECFKTGEWPGYPDNMQTAYLPGWFEKSALAQIERGELPTPKPMENAA